MPRWWRLGTRLYINIVEMAWTLVESIEIQKVKLDKLSLLLVLWQVRSCFVKCSTTYQGNLWDETLGGTLFGPNLIFKGSLPISRPYQSKERPLSNEKSTTIRRKEHLQKTVLWLTLRNFAYAHCEFFREISSDTSDDSKDLANSEEECLLPHEFPREQTPGSDEAIVPGCKR